MTDAKKPPEAVNDENGHKCPKCGQWIFDQSPRDELCGGCKPMIDRPMRDIQTDPAAALGFVGEMDAAMDRGELTPVDHGDSEQPVPGRPGDEGVEVDGQPVAGVCRVCGCTQDNGCYIEREDRVCGWTDATRTLCDNPECLVLMGIEVVPLAFGELADIPFTEISKQARVPMRFGASNIAYGKHDEVRYNVKHFSMKTIILQYGNRYFRLNMDDIIARWLEAVAQLEETTDGTGTRNSVG